MADVYKCLAQVNPSASTDTNIYTVPASTGTIISSLVICNRDAVERYAYVNVSHGAPTFAAKEYILMKERIPPNGFKIITAGICLTAADRIGCSTDSANMNFSLFGVEQNPIPAASPKLLGQSNPVAVTLTDLYTVPGSTSVVISSLFVAYNQASTNEVDPGTFRVAVSVGGGAIANKDYLAYDSPMPTGGPTGPAEGCVFAPVTGITLAATDKVRVYGNDTLGNPGVTPFSFNLFGVEIT